MGNENDEWEPQPARLREGERPDVSAHATRAIEQIRHMVSDGVLGQEDADAAVERILDADETDHDHTE